MLRFRDNFTESSGALRSHKLRAALTMLGLTMGVATLITVMTLVEGANVYVEQKIANLGTNVFQGSRVPLIITDFNVIIKALRNKYISIEDMHAVAQRCSACARVGGQSSSTLRVRYQDRTIEDTNANPINDAHVRLTWGAVANAARYRVYRSLTANGTFTQVGDVAGAVFDDLGQMGSSGNAFYVVKAADACGNVGP